MRAEVRGQPRAGSSRLDEQRAPPELSQDEVIERLEASGLTGMGGAGFPTWRKWDAVRREPTPRVVIVNADEGEPGTIKDRYVMELRPQLLLEGLIAERGGFENLPPAMVSELVYFHLTGRHPAGDSAVLAAGLRGHCCSRRL